jgi:hypothetical protein
VDPAARDYAEQLIGEMKEGEGHDPSLTMVVERADRRDRLGDVDRDAPRCIPSCSIFATQLLLLLWIAGTPIDGALTVLHFAT